MSPPIQKSEALQTWVKSRRKLSPLPGQLSAKIYNLVACGISLHTEIDMLSSKGGLTPFEALRTATSESARMLGIGNQVGTLAANMVADMIVVDGDPLARVSDARNIVATVANGRYLGAAALLEGYRGELASTDQR